MITNAFVNNSLFDNVALAFGTFNVFTGDSNKKLSTFFKYIQTAASLNENSFFHEYKLITGESIAEGNSFYAFINDAKGRVAYEKSKEGQSTELYNWQSQKVYMIKGSEDLNLNRFISEIKSLDETNSIKDSIFLFNFVDSSLNASEYADYTYWLNWIRNHGGQVFVSTNNLMITTYLIFEDTIHWFSGVTENNKFKLTRVKEGQTPVLDPSKETIMALYNNDCGCDE